MEQGIIRLDDGDEGDHFGYWTDLGAVELGEDNVSEIQAIPYGTWEHPIHGKLQFTPERAQRFADNVNNNVRGQQLDIDYDHKARSGEAAGWVKQARVDAKKGLMLSIEWTADAADKIRKKAYKYFSPEFVSAWKRPDNGQVYQDVLFGGAITNRPFLKGILPINLSELTGDDDPPEPTQGGSRMDRKTLEALAKKLGVEYDAELTDEDLQKLVGEAAEAEPENEPDPDDEDEPEEIDDEALAQLAEDNPVIALLLEERAETRKRIGILEASTRLSEVNVKLTELSSGKFTIAPALEKRIRSLAVKLDETSSTELFDILKDVAKNVVELGEKGGRGDEPQHFDDPVDEFNKRVKKLTEDGKTSYADAATQVALEEPALFDAYQEASYITERGGNRG